jgi:transmembrane sensor
MNRDSTATILVDPSVAKLKVSGVYRVGDNSAFARSLAKLLPIAVRENGETLILTTENDG